MTVEAQVYRSALRLTALVAAALGLVGALAGWFVAGGPGVSAALVGVGVAALSGLTTQGAMLVGHRRAPTTLAMLVLGSFLVKMAVIIGALVAVRGIDDFHRPLFGIFVMVGIVATLGIDVWVLRRARIPYADASSNPAGE